MTVSLLKSDFYPAVHSVSLNYLEAMDAKGRTEWALDHFGNRLVLTTSFGIQSSVLLHLAQSVSPEIPVVFIDTGYLHEEVYKYRDMVQKRLNLNLHTYRALRTPEEQEAAEGRRWEQGEERKKQFDLETKIEPLNRALTELGATAWLTGLRRGQNPRRAELGVTERQGALTKIYPLIDWSSKDIFDYMKKHDLPEHPLFAQGYTTVGNWFESAPGQGRGECGIHVQDVVRPSNFIL